MHIRLLALLILVHHQFNIHKFCIPPKELIYVLNVSLNNLLLFPYAALTDYFL